MKQIEMKELIEKLAVIVKFTAPNTDARKYSLNAIRFLVGNEMLDEAMKHVNE